MPSGLKNARKTFQRATDVIHVSACWQLALVYPDDIVVFSKSRQDHIEQIRRVLKVPEKAGAAFTLKNCKLFSETVDHLDHVIQTGRPKLAYYTTDAVTKLEHCTSQTELCSFLGLCNLFRWFVPNFVRLAALLNKKLKRTYENILASWMKRTVPRMHR